MHEHGKAAPAAATRSTILERVSQAALLPYRQELVLRMSLAVVVLALGLVFTLLIEQAVGAIVLTVPLLAILVAGWLGGTRIALAGAAVVTAVSIVIGDFSAATLIRVVSLAPTAIIGCLLLDSVRDAAQKAARLMEERVEAARLAEINQQRLDDALEGSHVMTSTQDLALRYTWIRNAAAPFFTDDIIGRSDSDILSPAQAHALEQVKRNVLKTGLHGRVQVTLATDSEQRTYDVSVKPLFQGGQLVGVSSVSTDITERILIEQELARANQVKDEFLSLISHEMKTPLTLIKGNATLLPRIRSDLSERDFDEAVLEIGRASSRLEQIIDDLLLLARLERGVQIEMEPVLLRRLADAVVNDHRRQFPQRRVRVTVTGAVRPVLAHPLYMSQVLRNLLSNAEKYSPPGLEIEVTVTSVPHEVSVSVRDQGTGIPEDEQAMVFESFFRSASSRKAPGIGVGLRVCRLLTEAQGGSITVENHPAGGAQFTVHLPPAQEDLPEE